MYQIDVANAAGVRPAFTPYGTPGWFQDTDPDGSTDVPAEWLNHVQGELAALVTEFGGTLDKADAGQIAALIKGRFETVEGDVSDLDGRVDDVEAAVDPDLGCICAKLGGANTQNLPYMNQRFLTWNGSDVFDPGAWHNPASASEEIAVPSAGLYQINAWALIHWGAVDHGKVWMRVHNKTTSVIGAVDQRRIAAPGGSNFEITVGASCTMHLAANDVIRVEVTQWGEDSGNTGVAATVDENAGFSMVKVR